MKNRTVKGAMIAGLLLFAGVSFGSTSKYSKKEDIQYIDVQVKSNQNNIVYVNFADLQGKEVSIRVFDNDGELIHTEKVGKNNAVLRRYDIVDAPNGPLSFEVIDTQMLRTKFDQK